MNELKVTYLVTNNCPVLCVIDKITFVCNSDVTDSTFNKFIAYERKVEEAKNSLMLVNSLLIAQLIAIIASEI